MNTGTPLEPNDPRLSAFVLGELPAEESMVISAMLRHSPEARKEVEQLQEMADLLRDSFALELEEAPVADQPTLAVLPFESAEESKVVPFRKESTPVERQLRQMKIVAIGSLAAAITMGLFLVPGLKPGTGGSSADPEQGMAATSPLPTTRGAVPSGPSTGPWVNYAEEGPSSGATGFVMRGIQPVSYSKASDQVMIRPLPQDPVIIGVHMLDDNPVEPKIAPLPASGLGYLDRTEYQEPEFVKHPEPLSGGIFREGDSVQSAYRFERRSAVGGSGPIIIQGKAQPAEKSYTVAPFGFDLEVSPPNFSEVPGNSSPETEGQTYLPPFELEATESIENRYLVKLMDRVHEAFQRAKNADAHLGKGDLQSAASELKMALQVLPDADATADMRGQLEERLQEVNASLRQR